MPLLVKDDFVLFVFMKDIFILFTLLPNTEMKRFLLYMCVLQKCTYIRIHDDLANIALRK